MKSIHSPHDLFFDQLRDMHSMEAQLFEALPQLVKLSRHPSLQAVLTDYRSEVDIQMAEISEIFTRFHVPLETDKCKAIEGLLEGGEAHLESVAGPHTRDLMMVAHCLRVTRYAIAACEITGRLAERLGLFREARTLGMILIRETETAEQLLAMEPGIFHFAHQTPDEIPTR